MNFSKKYRICQDKNVDMRNQKNKFLEFIFDEFLNENYGLKLENLF